jgi:hypothetical protein
VSDILLNAAAQISEPLPASAAPVSADAPAAGSLEKLDELENIDFLLEEIENKIAPLALA